MNEHLQPVFENLLPELESEGISYWVYGGVGVAAVAGRFIRFNGDVDIFVEECDFERVISLLGEKCDEIGLTPHRCKPLNGRPKFEVKPRPNSGDILSVVPVYRKEGHVEFIFGRRRAQYQDQMLVTTPRNIDGYRFFSPPDECVRGLFKTYLTNRPDKKKNHKVRTDAKAILGPEEFRELVGESSI